MDIRSYILENKLDVGMLENGEYVFCLLNGNEEVVYVGRSIKKYPNLLPHKEKGINSFISISTSEIGFKGSTEELFFSLIFKFVPQYNDVLPSNERYMSKGIIKKNFDINGVELNKLIRKHKALPIYREYYDIQDIFIYEESDH